MKVFDIQDFWAFAVLQSTIHEVWARQFSSTLETRLRYSTSDAFETFVFPENKGRMDQLGGKYYQIRQDVMIDEFEGFTKIYNSFHEENEHSNIIQSFRDLHVEMDNAVAAAYGWSDLDLAHGFHETKQGTRFTISEAARREVLARLLKLNHERYAEEVAQGLHDKKKGKPKAAGRKGKKPSAGEESLLF
jgi:hypothetical protein